jgi:hypothetical protein
MGLPVDPASHNADTLLDDQINGYWTTYIYNNNGYEPGETLAFAKGYWLGIENGADLTFDGEVQGESESIALQTGWNIISNPLALPIPADSLTFTYNGEMKFFTDAVASGWVNGLYTYVNESYVVPEELLWWEGAWLGVLLDGMTLTYPLVTEPVEAKSIASRTNGFAVNLMVSSESVSESLVVIGTADEATDAFDSALDAVYPPLPPAENYNSVASYQPDYALITGDYLSKNFKAISENDIEWTLDIRSSSETVTLSWTKENFPADKEMVLIREDGSKYDMLDVVQLSLNGNERIIIKVGSDVTSLENNVIPAEFYLAQNYPNPFNPVTTIEFGLPELTEVKVQIFNARGQLVRTLLSSEKNAGVYSIIWNGMNDQGLSMVSGVYFCRIQAGNQQIMKKMLLVK